MKVTEITRRNISEYAATADAGASLAQQAAAGAGTWGAAKGLGKALGKKIPGVGLALNAADAYDRVKKGDYWGAGIAGISGLAGLVPGVGTAASLGLDALNGYRDNKTDVDNWVNKQTGSVPQTAAPQVATLQPVPPGGNPQTFALQQKLIKAGAKIAADGKMGPLTQAAMKQFNITAEARTVAEDIRAMQQRLELINRS
jgi:hypothetical protein